MTWQAAMDYCAGLDLGGRMEWELPSRQDWVNLLGNCEDGVVNGTSAGTCDGTLDNKTVDSMFGNDQNTYWSTGLIEAGTNAYAFQLGWPETWVSRLPIMESHHVRCIRK